MREALALDPLCSPADLFSFVRPATTPTSPTPSPAPFVIVPVPGKGMGAIATRDIAKGELVLAEKPLLIISHAKKNEESIALFLARLPLASQAAYQSLAGAYPEQSPLLNIFETNVLQISASGRASWHEGVFEIASRFNHDCTPTLNHNWNPESRRLELVATRRVASGEELSISYIILWASRVDRQANLLQKCRFSCTCSTCSLPPAQVVASDTRRQNVNDIMKAIPALHAQDPRQLVVRARQALADLDAEGLVVGKTALCYEADQACMNYGDHEDAELWAKLGVECAGEAGDHSLQAVTMKFVMGGS